MALQEVCGFYDIYYLHHEWASTASGLDILSDTLHMNSSDCGGLLCSGYPLQLYVPVAEYLKESPLEFGQANPTLPVVETEQAHCSLPLLPFPAAISSGSGAVPLPFQLSHGTTTLAFSFQGGVIAAADTRSSCSGLVACPASQKILPIHSHLVGTTSGTSADCALWKRILTCELRLYQLRHRRRLSTEGAAKLLSLMLHPFKGTELCVAATLCGWDEEGKTEQQRPLFSQIVQRREKDAADLKQYKEKHESFPLEPARSSGPKVVYVCSDGLRLQGDLFSVGSGSPYAYSILDRDFCWGMSMEKAVALAREAVYRATHRDAYSGNNVDLYHITSSGWKRREREELKEEYYREKTLEKERIAERKRLVIGDGQHEKGLDSGVKEVVCRK